MHVSKKDRDILRELGGRVAEIAALPVQQEKIKLWKASNDLKPVRPMVIVDSLPWQEMDVDGELALQTEDGFCRYLETRLRRILYIWNHMPADMVVEPVVDVPIAIRGIDYGERPSPEAGVLGMRTSETTVATDPNNPVLGHQYIDQLATEEDVQKIVIPTIVVDEEATARAEEKAHEVLDGVIAVEMQGYSVTFNPWDAIVEWHEVEKTLFDLADRPELMHKIMSRYTDAYLSMLDQLEEQGLLGAIATTWATGQRTIDLAPDYTDELTADGFDPARPRPRHSARDRWAYGAAQIFTAISPAMFKEFELDYAVKWYSRFGLVHYGCCEQLHDKIDLLRQIPNLRKITMPPAADVARGAEQIGGDYVMSRRLDPVPLAMDSWEPDTMERDIRETVELCDRYGCPLQIQMRAVSTVRYEPQRVWEWADMAMRIVRDGGF